MIQTHFLFLTNPYLTIPTPTDSLYFYSALFPFCLFPCTLITALPHTAWTMTHSDNRWLCYIIVLLASRTFCMTPSDALVYTYFTISCVPSTISIGLVSVVDPSFVFVLLLQSIWFLYFCLYLVVETSSEPLNPWTCTYFALTLSCVSLQGHNSDSSGYPLLIRNYLSPLTWTPELHQDSLVSLL